MFPSRSAWVCASYFSSRAPGAPTAGAESQLMALAPAALGVKRDLTGLWNRLERKRGPRWLVSFSLSFNAGVGEPQLPPRHSSHRL